MSRCKACWASCLFLPLLPLSVLSLWLSPVMTVMSTMGPGDGISLLYQSALAPEPQDRNECLAHVASVHLLLRENERERDHAWRGEHSGPLPLHPPSPAPGLHTACPLRPRVPVARVVLILQWDASAVGGLSPPHPHSTPHTSRGEPGSSVPVFPRLWPSAWGRLMGRCL